MIIIRVLCPCEHFYFSPIQGIKGEFSFHSTLSQMLLESDKRWRAELHPSCAYNKIITNTMNNLPQAYLSDLHVQYKGTGFTGLALCCKAKLYNNMDQTNMTEIVARNLKSRYSLHDLWVCVLTASYHFL